MNLSLNFTVEEAVFSQTAARLGIDNSHPSVEVLAAAKITAAYMELVRTLVQEEIIVTSWIRCPALNTAVGSKPTSQHIAGEAVDFICPRYGNPLDICRLLLEHQVLLHWNQLILERTWVHIAWNTLIGVKNKGEVLSLLTTGGYSTGLTDPAGTPYPYSKPRIEA